MRRRDFALGLSAALVAACSKKPALERGQRGPPESGAATPSADWQTLAFDPSSEAPDGEEALFFAPAGSKDWPTLVALHGRGEAGRGLAVGSHGWRDDYDLETMHKHLQKPPLASADVGDMLDEARLAAVNASLSNHAYTGICVACPYTPIVADPSPEGAAAFGRFVVETLLPRIAAQGHPTARKTTGIDGVSMGGRLALLVGLTRPEAFGSVGALQPAIRVEEAYMLSTLAKRAIEKAPLSLRLVSSDEDPFLEAVHALSSQLQIDGVPHQLVITHGPHDYVWNRGPGGCEMLMFHERALRGLPPA